VHPGLNLVPASQLVGLTILFGKIPLIGIWPWQGLTKAHNCSSIYGTTKQTAEKLILEGHGFSRATIMIKNSRASAPEVRFFTTLLRDPLEKSVPQRLKPRGA
jgi:hypothetical protein